MSDASVAEEKARRALASPDSRVRLGALEELARAARPLEAPLALAVVGCLDAPMKAVQRRATDVLQLTSAAARPTVVAALRDALDAPDEHHRWGATYALGQLGVLEPALVSPLLDTLAHADGDRRWAAAAILVACGVRHPTIVVPAVRDALRAPSPELRKMAIYVLRDLAVDAADVVAEMLAATGDPDAGVRLAALAALSRLPAPPAAACDAALRLADDDPDPGVRRAAMSALGRLGRGVAAARAAVAAALATQDPGLRRAAEFAWRQLAE